ncbi:MAG: 1-deoxy-D-xylulose-5-phosphate synthase [Paludibacteraceae bacterium]|nr:1-deoxy-D-xylulose-5-phosphate synthase [Paludibacteraceae bacterium]
MSKERLLESINIPSDLKNLQKSQLPQLCDELRQFIIDELSQNPGHLGSSLGVVELSVALHYVLNTPHDRIVWDVGHQAYAHKILTGRRKLFHTNRQFKGISGFPSPKESEYDSFGTGHSSTSISAALGMSVAAQLKGDVSRQVVAVIGDGSMTGGLAFEGLNNASINPNNLLIILNDNGIAIDPIKSGIGKFLSSIHTSSTYNSFRFAVYKVLKWMHLMNDERKNKIIRLGNSLKASNVNKNNIFEGLNIRYFGPIDGHDVQSLVATLNKIKQFKGPKVLHCVTIKGKGYKSAEDSATIWHAPGLFNKETGERIKENNEKQPPLFQDVFGHTLLELARENEKIVGITPAMPSGCSMSFMMKEMPHRVFDVGIAEGHAVTFSAGLAKEGLIPFCNIYSSFMQRAYDNVIHDVALQNLKVILCLDRAGIVGSDGATHQGEFDMAYFRCIPNLTIASPYNEIELRNLMFTALHHDGPFVIRYPRGKGYLVDWQKPMTNVSIGKGRCLKDGSQIAVISIGPIGNKVAAAIEMLDNNQKDKVAHYDLRFVKPIDSELLNEVGRKFSQIITIEDGVINGGVGSEILEFMSENNYQVRVKRMGIPDQFVEHGTPNELYEMLGIDTKSIYKKIIETLKDNTI